MARKLKSVYERIEDKIQDIKETEKLLAAQNEELQTLYLEKDDLEMRQLLEMMKSKGLTIDQALLKFESDTEHTKESNTPKTKNKKSVTEDTVE
jgi:nitrate/nitrite-specific signal transduction histidine kinase